jgi:carbon monoxide dehydrogenase subunit G
MGIELCNSFNARFSASAGLEPADGIKEIAPCVPGMQLTFVDRQEYDGNAKVKLGSITA